VLTPPELTVNCSHFEPVPCLAPAGKECVWDVADHPRFHAERIAAAAFCDAVEHHEDFPQADPSEVKQAIDRAMDDLI